MATVLLVRHGRTDANAGGGLAGRSPVGLDEAGRVQAVALGERLTRVPLAAVLTSPLLRCRQTVALALPAATAVLEPRLTECGYGDWQGRTLQELADDPLWPVVQQHPSAVTFPGAEGEAMAEMAARAVAVLDVADIARWSPSLGRHVTLVRFEAGMHDLTLSAGLVRAEVLSEVSRWAAAYVAGAPPSATREAAGRSPERTPPTAGAAAPAAPD